MIGFGTGTAWYKEDPLNRDLVDILKTAVERGFRHIDASDAYGTEEEVGVVIKECGIPREEIFVTMKVFGGFYDMPTSIQNSLTKLRLDYVDLYLLHSTYLAKRSSGHQQIWLSMEQVKASGKAKSIRVSDQQRPHMEILKVAAIIPALNQLEFHPYLQRAHDCLSKMRAQWDRRY